MQLLKQLCQICAPSGNEGKIKDFILNYISENCNKWKTKPKIISGQNFQDCIILVFGEKPKTAIFAHMDSVGFTVKYDREIVKIGGVQAKENWTLVGEDSQGAIECRIKLGKKSNIIKYESKRKIDLGTNLVFKCNFRKTDKFVQSCYLDNRLGVWNALKVAETLAQGIICFSCWEEHGGGSVGYLARHIYEKHRVKQALISDITWVTAGVKHGKGVAISMRDKGIPRRKYVNKIIEIAKNSGIDFQLEVEDAGGSDGNALQSSPYPFDWCFIGAPEDHVHSPNEKVHRHDITCMLSLYTHLMKHL